MMKSCDGNYELLEEWFNHLLHSTQPYQEPILPEFTVRFIKKTCESLKQDVHVFAMSVEILEFYIKSKCENLQKVEDSTLAVAVSVFIGSKYVGECVDLKIKHIVSYLVRVTGNLYNVNSIKSMETDILKNGMLSFPVATKVDDVNVVVEKFIYETRFRANIRPLCIEMLTHLYYVWKDFFYELRNIYSQNEEALAVFKFLMGNKLYVPFGILITALRITNYQHVLDLDSILADITVATMIHRDHLDLLSSKIVEYLKTFT